MFVYLLLHIHEVNPGEEDEKLIGIYTSQEKANEARNRAITWPGFRDTPDGFLIEKYRLDEDHWTEGYFASQPG